MKLRRQAPAKAFIAATAAGLLFGLLALIRSEPRLRAQTTQPASPRVDYGRFFAPSTSGEPLLPAPLSPHARTRAS